MSTTFGVKVDKKYIDYTDFNAMPYFDGNLEEELDSGIIKVAFRSNGIRFTNPIASLLPDDTEVIPLDNTAQGIFTIGDIKKQIK